MSKPQRMPSSGEQGLLDTLEVRLLEASEIPRFEELLDSMRFLVGLPQAAKAQWQDQYTLLLSIDLVGGINYYRFRLTFSQDGRLFQASLTERTGLTDEQFEGVKSR